MDSSRPIALVQGQLPPVQLPDPPAKRGRKAQSQGGPARKRSKKADSEGATSGPEAAAAAAVGGKPPSGRRGGKSGGGKARSSKQDKEDEGLELVAGEETKVEEEPEERLGKDHSGVFSKDLPWLMYGFGDADKPIKETVDLVEDIAVQYVTETVHAAMAAAALRALPNPAAASSAKQKKDLDLEDLLFAVRRDPRKVARIQELIRRQKEIQAHTHALYRVQPLRCHFLCHVFVTFVFELPQELIRRQKEIQDARRAMDVDAEVQQ
ncbi:hypothetical protein OEZ86_007137 [Tetradesmus obliquus]|nr:hypothetical protein OEZ86_007137 [Tetradesmus obliquus]